jgi:hypothetical protein
MKDEARPGDYQLLITSLKQLSVDRIISSFASPREVGFS